MGELLAVALSALRRGSLRDIERRVAPEQAAHRQRRGDDRGQRPGPVAGSGEQEVAKKVPQGADGHAQLDGERQLPLCDEQALAFVIAAAQRFEFALALHEDRCGQHELHWREQLTRIA